MREAARDGSIRYRVAEAVPRTTITDTSRERNMAGPEIAIVGGGIVGSSVAFHLSERTDAPITVYERGDLAAETTRKSTAMIGVSGSDPAYRMQEYGFRLYNEFFADLAADPPPQYRQAGRLRVATTVEGARRLERLATDASERAASGESSASTETKYDHSLVDYVPGDDLHARSLLPDLDVDRIEGALYRPQYGYIRSESRTLGPRDLALEFVARARDDGVRFETNTAVTEIVTDGDAVTGLGTNDGPVDVETVVCAAGPWTPELVATAGLELPIEHIPSPVFALELEQRLPYTMPMIKSHESSVGIHLKDDETVLVTYTPDAGGEERVDLEAIGDAPLDEYRRPALREAARLVPRLERATLADEWLGVGVKTPDCQPIAGWTAIEGLSLAVTMAGIQFAPAVGDILARQLVDGDPTEYYDAVSISRFDGSTDC